jgi:hypothetical protein
MVLARDMEILRDLAKQGLPTGMSAPAAFMTELYARASREGRKLPKPDPDVLQRWGGESFLFPNFFFLPQFGNSLSYRARPDGFDPDSCIFEVWSLTLPAKGEPARRPTCVDVAHDDEEQLGLIPRQDFANIPRIQRGLHSVGFEATRLASYQERSILHYHRELDRYLTRA